MITSSSIPEGESLVKQKIAIAIAALCAFPVAALADTTERVRDSGGYGVWILANFSYAGMRAQGSTSSVWLILAFIFGLPGTILTYFVVEQGGERAYGVELPRKKREWFVGTDSDLPPAA
jgi:uncharacterized membrane protein YhaH (DUF805 family)